MSTVFTIGYQGATVEQLIETLKQAGVKTLLDVRSVPWSRRREFARRELGHALAAAGLRYEHLGELGNPDAGREAAKAGRIDEYRRVYRALLESSGGRAGLGRASDFMELGPVALMCMERDARRCHRTLAAERLAELTDSEVRHLRIEAGPETLPLFR